MALKLDDQPDSGVYDDNKPSWRTNMEDGLEDSYDAPSATDGDLPEGHPSRKDKKSSSADELNDRESGGGTAPKDSAAAKEKEALDSSDGLIGEGFKKEGKRRVVGKLTGRKKLIGGVAGLVIGGGVSRERNLVEEAKKLTRLRLHYTSLTSTPIVKSSLVRNAPILGAMLRVRG